MNSNFKKRAAIVAVASCLAFTPLSSVAAGLGKITVFSGLGQPLRAELDVQAARDETVGMTARLASQELFRQAGVDFASVLLDLRFTIEKRGNGQAVVKITSSKPVNEPFLDFLVEINWPAGRLVREYTFLLDPPDVSVKSAGRPATVVDAKVIATLPGAAAEPASRPSQPAKPMAEPRPVAAKPKPESSGDTHVVQRGETLRKIASETMPQGVSLEQMLLGLYKSNPDAFIGSNVNRLKTGAILSIPDKSSVEAVPQAEARKIYVAQANDWNAYRRKLASAAAEAPAKAESGAQVSSGKIAPKVQDKAAPAEPPKDQVKLTKTELAAQAAVVAKVAENEIAKEKSLKEAQSRLAILEKNVIDLQKLVEAKNEKLAELQKQSSVAKEEVKPAPAAAGVVPKAPEEAKPVEPPKAVEAPKPEPEPVKPVAAVEPTKPVEAVKPSEPAPPAPPKVAAPALPEPEPEPSFVDGLLADPLPLAGGAGILALLAGYFFYKRRRPQAPAETTAAPGPSSLGPNSVFRMTGGQSVDTGNTPPQTGDFSQTGPGTIDTDEVDPVAEADVYMAYGRDAQAEEILIEALQKDPQRTAIHGKLLEIYANRKSLKQFETLASELYAQTGGAGPEWAKVAALGAGLDPANPLYSVGHSAQSTSFDADATMIVSPDLAKSTLAVSGGMLAQAALEAGDTFIGELPVAEPVAEGFPEVSVTEPDIPLDIVEDAPVAVDDVMSLDFDLGSTNLEPNRAIAPEPVAEPDFVSTFVTADADADADALDFDLGGDSDAMTASAPGPVVDLGSASRIEEEIIDFDLGTSTKADSTSSGSDPDSPDFSADGTMVMPHIDSMTDTFVGIEPMVGADDVLTSGADESLAGFELNMDADNSTATVVNPDALRMMDSGAYEAPEMSEPLQDEPVAPLVVDPLVASVITPTPLPEDDDSLEFDVRLTDSTVLGQPMQVPSYDIGSINLDLSSDAPAEPGLPTAAVAEVTPASPAAVVASVESVAEPDADFSTAQREEVSTKLDLAKAYEEMGDLEGARELLDEVSKEGPPDLVEQAREILGRIGG